MQPWRWLRMSRCIPTKPLQELVVGGERFRTFQTKAAKDLRQAGALIEVLRELRSWDVEEAWQELMGRGPGWIARARRGLAMLDNLQMREWLTVADNASEAV